MAILTFTEVASTPPTPAAGQADLYIKTDNVVYTLSSGGVETALGSSSAITSLTGDATATGPGAAAVTLTNSAVTGQVLTGFSAGPNSPVTASDTILEATEKLQAQVSASSSSAITALTGDVSASGPGSATATVNSVGGQTASAIASATVTVDAATSTNTASTLVERDASGNFAANIITASLNGNASTATSATNATTAVNFSGSLSGDVTGTQSATSISSPTVTGKLLTGYTAGTNTPIIASNSILTAFENLQAQVSSASGSAITALTGDGTATGPGSATFTLATVNSSPGTYGSAGNQVATVTVNGKGLVTSASNTNISGLTNSNLSGSAGITGANIATNTVTNNNLAQMAANTVKANTSGVPATPVDTSLGTVTESTSSVLVLTGWSDATIGSPTIQVEQSGASQSGYLSSTDWNTFNSKQTSGNYITALTGDVSASGPGSVSATVNSVGGSTAASIHSAAVAVAAATSVDTPSTLVERDASGNFSAGTITATLNGNASNITATSNSTLTTLSSLSLPGSQVTGNISGNAANITATSNSTLTSLPNLVLPTTQLSGDISLTTQVSGVLPVANGGTNNSSSYTAGSIIFSNGTALTQDNSNFYWNDATYALGIGTIPASTVMIDGVNTSGASKLVQMTGYGAGSTTGYRGRYARGTSTSPSATQSGDTLNVLSGRGYGTSQFAAASTGIINVVAGENFTNSSNATYLQFEATPTGSVTASEHMRVAATGVTLGPQSSSTDLHTVSGGWIRTTKTVTANYTVDTTTTDDVILCNQTGAITITLPTATVGRTVVIKDISGNAQTNPITLTPASGTTNIEGLNANKSLYTNFGSWTLHVGSAGNWWFI